MDPRLHILGIRHHGPGCAASLERALNELDPNVVLVEGPPEATPLIPQAMAPGMKPPLALLSYPAANPDKARFFPFAEFSPEWRALQWALKNDKPVLFIDAPYQVRFESEKPASEEQSESTDRKDRVSADPLGMLANAAGHSDGESWWNSLVEQHTHAPDVFDAIEIAMTALREVDADESDSENDVQRADFERDLVREAHMRTAIRKALKEHEGDIAVVCGAWHVPALRRKVTLSSDKELLKGQRSTKMETCWIPWTDQRLAFSSGYGAGVVSPGWYRFLWQCFETDIDAEKAVASWQTRASWLLREEGLPASTASVIEASRLATSLAVLRGLPVIGLQEMQDASLAALCHGERLPLSVINERLIIGTRVGEVDESIPQPPLQADLQRLQKKLRLKPDTLARDVSLDLRSDAGSSKSALLHRLHILDVEWGKLGDAGTSRGTFREMWRLEWKPEFSVKLAEALIYGPTIEQAASGAACAKAATDSDCSALAELVRQCLLADLPVAADLCINQLQHAAVRNTQISSLIKALIPLIDVLRYGTARRMPETTLRALVLSLTHEVCINFRYGCHLLDEDAATQMYSNLNQLDRSVALLEDERSLELWIKALNDVILDEQVPAILRGCAERTLYDRQQHDQTQTGSALSRALSAAVPVTEAGKWLEGFLKQSGEILLADDDLFELVDTWLCGLESDAYLELLPVLRRAMSGFDSMSRRRLLERVRSNALLSSSAVGTVDDASAAAAFAATTPLLCKILGLPDDEEFNA